MLVLGVVVWQGVPLLIEFWFLLSASLEWPVTVLYFRLCSAAVSCLFTPP